MKRMRELRYRRFYADRPIDPKITVNRKKAPKGAFFMRKINKLFFLGRRRRLVADGSLGMFQMVANCELRKTGTQTSNAAAGFVQTLRSFCKKH